MGLPPSELAARMTEHDFGRLQQFADRRMLPQRRLELYLAQIALWAARGAGAKDVMLRDFMFDPEEPEPESDPLESAKHFFGFAPRN